MLRASLLAIALLLPGALLAADDHAKAEATAGQLCSDFEKRFPPCGLSKSEQKQARQLYKRAMKLSSHDLEEAFKKLHEARAISPQDAVYAGAEQSIGEKIVKAKMNEGNLAMQRGDAKAALAAFERATEIDPTNDYALQRLHDATPETHEETNPSASDELTETRLRPAPGLKSFEFKGGSTEFLQQFTKAYGVTGIAEQGFQSRPVRIKLDNVGWEQGSAIVSKVCKALMIPMGSDQVLLATDSEENRRDLVRMSLRTFYVPGEATQQDITEMATALRVMFDLRYITPNVKTGTIVIRAAQPTMDAVAQFLDGLRGEEPTVMLNVKIFAISTAFTRDLGASVPTEFTVFNVTSEVKSLLSSSTYSEIVSALEAAGQTVNADTILAALIASASSLGTSSPLSQPFATFGGGLTLSGVTVPSTSLSFSVDSSMTRTVDDVMLRAAHGKAATFKVGERYPIVSTKYSASSATSSLLSALGVSTGTSTTVPSPQFNYEDIGLVLKATPHVNGNLVSLDYELTLRSLGATQVNGLPLLVNQENKGSISTMDGESVVIAGMVDQSQMASIDGIPLLSSIPVLGGAFSTTTREKTASELLIVVTPHLDAAAERRGSYILIPKNVPK
jgi:type II secretory pathway component GspD/PulD (secretin)